MEDAVDDLRMRCTNVFIDWSWFFIRGDVIISLGNVQWAAMEFVANLLSLVDRVAECFTDWLDLSVGLRQPPTCANLCGDGCADGRQWISLELPSEGVQYHFYF